MSSHHSSALEGLHAVLVVIIVGLSVIVAAKGLIELAYLIVGASRVSWLPFFEVGLTTPIIVLLLKRDDWLRTFALIFALGGLGGFVKIGVELTRAYSIGTPLHHSPDQYFGLGALYALGVLSFFVWYFWDKSHQPGRRFARKHFF